MICLIWHLKNLYIGNVINSDRIKEIKQDDVTNLEIDGENVISPWVTVESKDDIEYFDLFLKDILFLKKRFNTNKIIIMPFAHLTNKICKKEHAFYVITKLKNFLIKNGFECNVAHFGSGKDVKFFSESDKYQAIYRKYPLLNFKKNFYK